MNLKEAKQLVEFQKEQIQELKKECAELKDKSGKMQAALLNIANEVLGLKIFVYKPNSNSPFR